MLVLQAAGSQPLFRFSNHSVEIRDRTLLHIFPGEHYRFVPGPDGPIAILALYLLPSSNADVKMWPIQPDDIALWEHSTGSFV